MTSATSLNSQHMLQDKRISQLQTALEQEDSAFIDSFGNPYTQEGCAQLNLIDQIHPINLYELLVLAQKVSRKVETLLLGSIGAPSCLDQEGILKLLKDAVAVGDSARMHNLSRSGCMAKLSKWQIGFIYVHCIECQQEFIGEWLKEKYPFLKTEKNKFIRIYKVSNELHDKV